MLSPSGDCGLVDVNILADTSFCVGVMAGSWLAHGQKLVSARMLTSTKPQSPLGDSTLAILPQWLPDSSDLGTPTGKTPSGGARLTSLGSFMPFLGSIQPWMAMVACERFYKVDSLAVATRISH